MGIEALFAINEYIPGSLLPFEIVIVGECEFTIGIDSDGVLGGAGLVFVILDHDALCCLVDDCVGFSVQDFSVEFHQDDCQDFGAGSYGSRI